MGLYGMRRLDLLDGLTPSSCLPVNLGAPFLSFPKPPKPSPYIISDPTGLTDVLKLSVEHEPTTIDK